jgi:uncharacterized protein YjbJ (UPF0337 family)
MSHQVLRSIIENRKWFSNLWNFLREKEAIAMANEDLLSSNWKSLRPRVKERWHGLTDDDLALIAGNRAVLASVLCEKYTYSEEQAQQEIEQFLAHVTA